jgi:mannose-6-phosphate isomerase-like protein (cupin superfamily)
MKDQDSLTHVEPDFFKLRIQLMDQGSFRHMLADTGNLKIKIRCYAANNGENAMHAHYHQDHSFIILDGQARFHFPDGSTRELNRNEGIMLPHGCYYCFENSGPDALVVLRIESITAEGGDPEIRKGTQGQQINPHAPENNRSKTPVFRPNAFYE